MKIRKGVKNKSNGKLYQIQEEKRLKHSGVVQVSMIQF
jgi:hypothetical protein